ncbi:TetR/AcrR family transcriptional regulator [Alteribacillus sp. YIM 98480]|uniref:TetR/AcrR family transcriptional regulator n=1 Tax=Alteribacillus sp. YIM 98480 TaxID=2606599 RepID=UPI00131CE590|nr:TetR/AcrR family transcriptional regulator [Alteribacillus sp. YIM 98480]
MKEDIIKTSIQLFEQQGFSETSIQDIVQTLGVTKGTFYYYFNSKEQVLMTIHSLYIDNVLEQQKTILKNKHLRHVEKLHQLIDMLITNISPRGQSARVFFREFRHLSESHLNEVRPKRDEIRNAIEKVIIDGMQAGVFRQNLKPDIITLGILGACNWTYQWFNPEGKTSDKEVASIYVDMILNGISTEQNKN